MVSGGAGGANLRAATAANLFDVGARARARAPPRPLPPPLQALPLGEADVASVASLALPEGGAQAEHLRDQVTAAWPVERHDAPDMLFV